MAEKLIQVSEIDVFHGNARKEDDGEHVATMAADIEQRGLLHPITVRETDDGRYEAIAGQRRLQAFKLLGRKAIPARVVVADDDEGFLISLSENMHRTQMSNKDKCRAIARCYHECDGNVADVVRLTHLSESTVRRYLDIATLPDDVITRLDANGDDRITIKEAHDMARGRDDAAPPPPPPAAEGGGGETKQRKKGVKTEPWVYNPDGEPVPIPDDLHARVYDLVRRHNA